MVDYDLIIIGSGPSGMNACLYASRANLKTLVIERAYPGGKIVKANTIENWLGNIKIEGIDLALQMYKHAFSYGGVYEQNNVLDIVNHGKYKEVILDNKSYKCYAVIIATGVSERKIGLNGEEKFYGKGVSFCAVCDAPLYKNKVISIIGNSEKAIEESLYLSEFAQKIYLINIEKKFNVDTTRIDHLLNEGIIEIKNNYKLISIDGKEQVESITIEDSNNQKEIINVSAVFPFIGNSPDTRFISRLDLVDKNNYIIVNEKQETKIKGIFASGDCTNSTLKQIITASSQGAVAALEAYKYIEIIKK